MNKKRLTSKASGPSAAHFARCLKRYVSLRVHLYIMKIRHVLKEMLLSHKGNYAEAANSGGLIILWPLLACSIVGSIIIGEYKYILPLAFVLLGNTAAILLLATFYKNKYLNQENSDLQ
ncbi:hypothetical protein [Oceanicoccus sp. KOV_DT_Chl]|uniref:hypothetical protein n=1 Tax=Oceanicoccus sp. KOV_DT_Chl TaxID=1904639 RepID=UPI000C7A1391|nr:hypothetical protein [Oceanicoccus sp. KOV_DT_Chl]